MAQRLLENTLDRTARIISQRAGVSVVFRGDEVPHTDGKTITLPSPPTPCSKQIERVMNGLLDHELGHVLYSNFSGVAELRRQHGEHYFQVLNILEDLRVEKLIEVDYPGAKININEAYVDMNQQWDAAMPLMPLWIRLGGCLFAEGKGWDTARYGPDACRIVRSVADLVHQAVDAPSTGHIAKLAVLLMQRLKAKTVSQPDQSNAAITKGPPVRTREREALAVALSTAPGQNAITLATLLGESIKEATTAASHLPYRVYDRSNDVVEYAADGCPDIYQHLLELAQPHIAGMRQKLLTTLRGKTQSRMVPSNNGTFLDRRRLHNLCLGIPCSPFLSKGSDPSLDVAVSLLIDQSGSMFGEKMWLAKQCAVLLAETMDQLHRPLEIIGFSSRYDRSYLGQLQKNEGISPAQIEEQFARFVPTLHLIYKGFKEPLRKVRGRFATMKAMNYTPLNESVRLAGQRLLEQPASARLLIVLTDGDVMLGSKQTKHIAHQNLLDNLKGLKKAGIEVMGIGIKTDYVQTIFPSSLVVHDVSQLPQQFFTAISRQLLR